MFNLKEFRDVASTKKLIIIEDEKDLNIELVDYFSIFFEIVDFAFDGEEGYNKILENEYDIILTDYNMPKLNALNMMEKLHKTSKSIPNAILATGQKNEIELESNNKKVFYEIVNKPWDYDYLGELMMKILI